jgi:hypothetical protein
VLETTARFAATDFDHALLGDARRSRRASEIAAAISKNPGLSFPRAFRDKAGLEGFYRFVNNGAVSYEPLVEAHAEATAERADGLPTIAVVHDTTECVFDASVEGMGRLRGRAHGFLAHVALAVTADGQRRPLGVLGMIPVVRNKKVRGKKSTQELAKLDPNEKESRRWPDLVDMTEGRMAGRGSIVHVADREADSYPLLSHFVTQNVRFAVRISRDRKVEEATGDLSMLREAMQHTEIVVERTVPLRGRPARYRQNGLLKSRARTEREARLAISAQTLQFKQPRHWRGSTLPSLTLNVVWVREVDPPAGEEGVDWLIATTEPIGTPEQIEAVVDLYRARWIIEEFFKALKTGCEFEKRQLESLDALLTTLALLFPVACELLLLRHLARNEPTRRALDFFSSTRLDVLRAIAKGYKLPANPTLRDALLAVASLGGHIKNNGEPGWIVLGRGMEELLAAEVVWAAALRYVQKM